MTQKAKVKNSDKTRQMYIIGGIIAVAVIIFGVVLFFAAPNTGSLDYNNVIAEQDDNGEWIVPENDPFVVAERLPDGGFVIGNPDAAVTVVVWEDFLCPHCQAYQSTVKRFVEDFVFTGQARFEFRMLPISTQSGFIFSLVECAAVVDDNPAAFWYAHDEMFRLTTTNGTSLDGSDFANAIEQPYGSLLDCADEATQYQTDQQLASTFDGQISGTPAVAWRLNGGNVRLDIINRQPSYEDLAGLVQVFGQQ